MLASKLFFMHIPKTAGTSFKAFLIERTVAAGGSYNQWSDAYHDYELFVSDAGRYLRETDLICGHYPFHVTELLDPTTRVVTVLRDPLSRCVSHIKHEIAHRQRLGQQVVADVNEYIRTAKNARFLRTLANLSVKYFCYRGSPNHVVEDGDLSVTAAVENCSRTLFGFTDDVAGLQQRIASELFNTSWQEDSARRDNQSSDRFSVDDLLPENRARLQDLNVLELRFLERVRALP